MEKIPLPDGPFVEAEFIAAARAAGAFCLDVEHHIDRGWRHPGFKLDGVSLYTPGSGPHYVLTDQSDFRFLETLFETCETVAHNAKYDLVCLKRAGLIDRYPTRLFDTMLATNLWDENIEHGELGLKKIIPREFGYRLMEFQEAYGTPEFTRYASEDAYWTYRLYLTRKQQLEQKGQTRYFEKIMIPGLLVFCDLELAGMKWSLQEARKMYYSIRAIRDRLYQSIHGTLGNVDINSPKQLSKRIFGELGYTTKYSEKGKNGHWGTGEVVMARMAKRYPVCREICTFRTCEKLISTYLTPLTEQAVENFDNRVRGSFWLVSKTGRTRCSDANLQNVPVTHNLPDELKQAGINLRRGFVAPQGKKLVVQDFSQIELRFLAHITNDPVLLSAYRSWECRACGKKGESGTILHSCPLCGKAEDSKVLKGLGDGFWHGLDIHSITTDRVQALNADRQAGKICNFSLAGMATARTMHNMYPNFTVSKWQESIEGWFDLYKGVRGWHQASEARLRAGHPARDVFGRLRTVTEHDRKHNFKHALNQYVNVQFQGSALGLALICLRETREKYIKEALWGNGVQIVNFIHDENVFEVDESIADQVFAETQWIMENSIKIKVPIRAEGHVVDAWGLAK